MDYLQIATVEVPEEHMGPVVELLGKRRGQMIDMQGLGYVIHIYIWLSWFYLIHVVTMKGNFSKFWGTIGQQHKG